MPLLMDLQEHSAQQSSNGAGIQPTLNPKQLAISLPFSPHTTLHLQVTCLETSNMIFMTSTDPSSSASLSSLGSFVYAMPNRLQPSDPLCTALYSLPSSIDFATRVSKILARKTGKPIYVGCSVIINDPTVEEELASFRTVVEEVMKALNEGKNG